MKKAVGAVRSDKAALSRRAVSVVKAHALLFDSSLLELQLGSRAEYESLLDFAESPSRGKIRRVMSIIRAHELLFATGLIDRDEAAEAEIPRLLRYLSTLVDVAPVSLNRSNILPKNLGIAFVRKRLGVPLFGYCRPRTVPSVPGLILCYQSIAAEGIARIAAVRSGEDTVIRYKNLGVELDSAARWFHCVIAPADEEPSLTPSDGFSRKAPTLFEFDSYAVYLAAGKKKTTLRAAARDPFRYQYTYFFFDDGSMRANMSRFLRDLLTGMFGIPARDAEPVVVRFIERSL